MKIAYPLLILLIYVLAAHSRNNTPPNILVFIADETGVDCSPSRSSILTGKYAQHFTALPKTTKLLRWPDAESPHR